MSKGLAKDETWMVNALTSCLYDEIIPLDFVKEKLGKGYWKEVEKKYKEQRKKNLEQNEWYYNQWRENARRGVREAEEQLIKSQERLDNVEDDIKRHRQENAY